MSKKCQKQSYEYYKTKEELLKEDKNIDKIDCAICLQPIFYEEPIQILDNAEKEDKLNNSIDNNTSRNEIEISVNNESKKENDSNTERKIIKNIKEEYNKNNHKEKNCVKKSSLFKEIMDVLFLKGFYSFYRIEKNPKNKKYMKPPCHHVFHSVCLEKWFLRKKECPTCRYQLPDIID